MDADHEVGFGKLAAASTGVDGAARYVQPFSDLSEAHKTAPGLVFARMHQQAIAATV
jgi:hypothetical protein